MRTGFFLTSITYWLNWILTRDRMNAISYLYLLFYKSIWDFVGCFSLALLWCLKSFQTEIYAACFCVNPWNVSKERWSINVDHICSFLVLWSLLQTKMISGFSRLQFLPPTKLRVMPSTQVFGQPNLMVIRRREEKRM